MNSDPKPDRNLKAILHVCAAFFMFTAMQAFNKKLTGIHHVVEIAFYRNLMALIPCIIFVLMTRRYSLLKSGMPAVLTARATIGSIGLILTFAAAQALPLSNATVIFFTSTLMIPVFAHFFLKERIGRHRWIAVGIGMIGVIIVAQPTAEMTTIGVALALSAATIHAIIQVLIRAMKSENTFTITFYFFLTGVILSGVLMPFVATMPTAETIPYLLAIGVTGGLGQLFLTSGFKMAEASLLSPFNYTGLIWATLLDVLIWSYVPGWPVFLGSAIIMGSYFYILYREKTQNKDKILGEKTDQRQSNPPIK